MNKKVSLFLAILILFTSILTPAQMVMAADRCSLDSLIEEYEKDPENNRGLIESLKLIRLSKNINDAMGYYKQYTTWNGYLQKGILNDDPEFFKKVINKSVSREEFIATMKSFGYDVEWAKELYGLIQDQLVTLGVDGLVCIIEKVFDNVDNYISNMFTTITNITLDDGYKSTNSTSSYLYNKIAAKKEYKDKNNRLENDIIKNLRLEEIDWDSLKENVEDVKIFNEIIDILIDEVEDAKTIEEIRDAYEKFYNKFDYFVKKYPYKTKYDQLDLNKLIDDLNLDDSNDKGEDSKLDFNKKPIVDFPSSESYGNLEKNGDIKYTKTINRVDGYPNRYKIDYKIETLNLFKNANRTNVIIMVDTSNSMDYVGERIGYKSKSRINVAKEKIEGLINTLFELEDPNIYVSLYKFSGSTSKVGSDFNYLNKEEAISNLESLSLSGGTNHQEALRVLSKDLDENGLIDDKNILVMISDGEPTSGLKLKDINSLSMDKLTFVENTEDPKESYYLVNENIEASDYGMPHWSNKYGKLNGYEVMSDIINDAVYYSRDFKKNTGTEIYTVAFQAGEEGDKLMKDIASSEDHFYLSKDTDALNKAFSEITTGIIKSATNPVLTEELNPSFTFVNSGFSKNTGVVDYNGFSGKLEWNVEDFKQDPNNPNLQYAELSYIVEGNELLTSDSLKGVSSPIFKESKFKYTDKNDNEVVQEFEDTPVKPNIILATTEFKNEEGMSYLGKNIPVEISSGNKKINYYSYDGNRKLLDLTGDTLNINASKDYHNTEITWQTLDGKLNGKLEPGETELKLPLDENGNPLNIEIKIINTLIPKVYEVSNPEDPVRPGYVRYTFFSDSSEVDIKRGALETGFRKSEFKDDNGKRIPQEAFYYDMLEGINTNYLVEPYIYAVDGYEVTEAEWDEKIPEIATEDKVFIAQYKKIESDEIEDPKDDVIDNEDPKDDVIDNNEPEKPNPSDPVKPNPSNPDEEVIIERPIYNDYNDYDDGYYFYPGMTWFGDGNKTTDTPVTPVTPVNTGLPFKDVLTSDWFYDAVKSVYGNNVMVGVTDDMFEPSGVFTRAQMAQVIYNLENKPSISAKSKFSDVADSSWYNNAVVWCEENGVIKGFEDGTFKPDSPITRQEIATILFRYAGFKGIDTTNSGDLSKFKDNNTVSDFAADAMKWAAANNIFKGDDNNNLRPLDKATRAEVAQIMANSHTILKK